MDERTRELMERLRQAIVASSDGPIADMVDDVRHEALAEARAILKDLMVQATLERALTTFEDGGEARGRVAVPSSSVSSTTSDAGRGTACRALSLEAEPNPDSVPSSEATETSSEEEIRREMEAIRAKMAENERALHEIKETPEDASNQESEALAPPSASGSGADGEAGRGVYVYGVIERAARGSGFAGRPGIDSGHPVYTLAFRDLEAVVSEVSLGEFGEEALKANVQEMAWLESKVYAHQGVLDALLSDRPLVPLTFCTIYETEDRVLAMLEERYEDLMEAMGRVRGAQEWGAKVSYDCDMLARAVERSSERVQALVSELEGKSAGAAYFAEKKRDRIVEEEMERLCDECAQCTHDRLADRARASVISALDGGDATNGEGEMVLNGAYLVAHDDLEAFRGELTRLETEYGELGFRYVLTGPWPPYNFVRGQDGEDVAVSDAPVGG
jgi:hypothetical protein